MNSPHQREQLPDLLSDALNPAERARVESHLAGCEQCARELRALQQMQQTLAALPAATPPARIRANVRAALRENPKQARALPDLWPNRARNKAWPFALPARPLAWGGALALGAIGLMVLARPSLHNDAFSPAPVDETQLAARAASNASAAPNASADAVSGATAKKPATPRKDKRDSALIAPNKAAKSGAPGASQPPNSRPDLSSIAPPPILPPSTRVAPSSNASQDFASIPVPAPKPSNNEPEKRSGAPKSALTKPKSQQQTAPAPPRTAPQKPGAPGGTAPVSPPPADMGRANSRADDSSTAFESSGAEDAANRNSQAPVGPAGPAAPAPANSIMNAPALAQQQDAESTDDWPGGAVEANISATPNVMSRAGTAVSQAPVLTLRVALAIGNARLIFLLPNGETQVWRGSLNAVPVAIPLGKIAGQARSGQKIRARLEQIDGEGNPTSRTLFDLTWP